MDKNKNTVHHQIQTDYDVGLSIECTEEIDDCQPVQVKCEPVNNEEVDSSDQVMDDKHVGCRIKTEPCDDAENEEAGYTAKRNLGHVDSNLAAEGGMEQCVSVKTEPYDQIEPCDDLVIFEPSRSDNMVSTFQYEKSSTNYPDQMQTDPDCSIPFEVDEYECTELQDLGSKQVCIKTENLVENNKSVKKELNSSSSGSTAFSDGPTNMYVFPQATATSDSKHVKQRLSGLASLDGTGDEESVGSPSYCQPNFSAAPRPGQLPIHVVDSLHRDKMKMEEETGVTCTCIPNLHMQPTATQHEPETEALDLSQTAGQSTGEPSPVCVIIRNAQGSKSKQATTICKSSVLFYSQADPFNWDESSNSQSSENVMSPLLLQGGAEFDIAKQHGKHLESHSCKFCDVQFANFGFLQDHESVCVKRKQHKCSYCRKEFALKKYVIRHERIHTGEKPFGCAHCEMRFTQKPSLIVHLRTHTGERPFKCEYCEMCFTDKKNLKRHERIHTGEKPFGCSLCERRFTQKQHLLVHERTHTGEKPFSCELCEKTFSVRGNLLLHQRVHTGEKPFRCGFCDESFTVKSRCTEHERIHTGETPFECTHCGKAFIGRRNLTQHERSHTGEKPFACDYCDMSFPNKSRLSLHESIHTGDRRFKCPHCERTFNTKGRCAEHERGHTGEKPFQCNHCEKAFGSKRHLTQHQLIHIHTEERPFKCGHCERGFTYKSVLVQHERIHTGEKPFRCGHCEKGFTSNAKLERHERIHTGEKPFPCTQCEMRFTEKGQLTRHWRIHTGEKQCKCSQCGKGFASKAKLDQHERVHDCLYVDELPMSLSDYTVNKAKKS
ncbi:zinc finger protein 271-like [Lineus longissimus]|uniref:zinc finger protein 271-like n=1 Tax=Lineus longissimus TaxID=88925 RepID=UPI00315DECFC